jgi:hypothetical protein
MAWTKSVPAGRVGEAFLCMYNIRRSLRAFWVLPSCQRIAVIECKVKLHLKQNVMRNCKYIASYRCVCGLEAIGH